MWCITQIKSVSLSSVCIYLRPQYWWLPPVQQCTPSASSPEGTSSSLLPPAELVPPGTSEMEKRVFKTDFKWMANFNLFFNITNIINAIFSIYHLILSLSFSSFGVWCLFLFRKILFLSLLTNMIILSLFIQISFFLMVPFIFSALMDLPCSTGRLFIISPFELVLASCQATTDGSYFI